MFPSRFIWGFVGGALALCTAASASPVLESRSDYHYPILEPTASSVWTIGQSAAVAWDNTLSSSDPDPVGNIDLYDTASFGSALYVTTLAYNVNFTGTSVDIVVPEVDPGSYFIMLNAWANSSPHFEIVSA